MAVESPTKPVEDTIGKVNDELAVGSDLEFQSRWWRFERIAWIVLIAIVIADVLGCFGRGPLANAQTRASDRTMDVKYERIERYSTPSILTIQFGPSAIHDGKIQLWASEALIKPLGNQRVIPQPSESVLDGTGILYTFASTPKPNSVQFALQPSSPGIQDLTLHVPGSEPLHLRIYVMP